MDPQVVILIVSFLILLIMHVPVAVALGICAFLTLISIGEIPASYTVAQRMSTGIASFPLLAIPFFVLAGILMGEGGMARRLINFASVLIGPRRGALAYVSTITCMMFGAISGSAAAAVSSVGGMMIPEMTRKGYGRPFSVAVTTTAATTGLIIPPSNIMIVYSLVAGGVSIAGIFMAGVGPGILIGLSIMFASWFMCPPVTSKADSDKKASWKNWLIRVANAGASAAPSLLLIVIVLGGILGGIFSPTEASAFAVLYAFMLTVVIYREITLSSLSRMFQQAALTTAVIFFLIGTSQAMSWVMTNENIPQTVSNLMLGISDNPVVILLAINLLLLFVGTFMDMTPAVLIFTPILLPVVTSIGMDPTHFGVMMIANLCIGLCTPPVGTCLFLGCGVGKTTIAEVARPMIPLFAAMIAALLVITFWSPIALWLPHFLKLIDVDN